MRLTPPLTWPLAALLLATGTAQAAPQDPYVVYTANSFADGAVVLRTDPATGALTEISRNGPQGALFRRPYDLAVEADGNLVVADLGAPCTAGGCPHDGRIIRVDPLTGAQSLVSSGGELVDPAGLAVAPTGQLWVVDSLEADNNGAVIRIDPRSGAQTVVSRNRAGGAPFDLPFGIAVDRDGSLVVTNRVHSGQLGSHCPAGGRILRVNPVTGDSSVIAAGNPLAWPLGVALEPGGDIVVANECATPGRLIRVGAQQPVITPRTGPDLFAISERVALDPSGALLVTDYGTPAAGEGGIVKVDPVTGAQALVSRGDLFNYPLGIAVVANRPPTAALTLSPSPVAAGRTVRLDASASRDPDGLRLVHEWDLDGDGSFETGSGATAVVDRVFAVHGPRTIRVRVNDPHGGRAEAEQVLDVDGSVPVITSLKVGSPVLGVDRRRRATASARRRPPRVTTLRFELSEAASASVAVERGRAGRRRKGACRALARRGPRCTHWTRVRLIRKPAVPGANSVRIRSRGLRPGRHRVVVDATDVAGNRSISRSLRLRVVRVRPR
jgi:DNA-binding beta-propeller fold protein YncE